MKKLSFVGLLVILIVLSVVSIVQASPSEPLYLEKVCIDYADACSIQNSSLDVLEGGTITYVNYHSLDEEKFFLSADVAIDVEGGSARGHFVFKGDSGHFTIQKGSGTLKGFHAQGTINWIEDSFAFPLEGKYHFDPK